MFFLMMNHWKQLKLLQKEGEKVNFNIVALATDGDTKTNQVHNDFYAFCSKYNSFYQILNEKHNYKKMFLASEYRQFIPIRSKMHFFIFYSRID